jgi:uncharacterized repeat protein (TIGR02543 family)
MGSSDVTLSAVWTQVYTVTYAKGTTGSPSGSVPVDSATYQSGANVTVLGNTGTPSLTNTGYTFAGWSYGGTAYQSGSTLTMGSGNVTLTAQWTAIPVYSVSYAPGTGGGSVTSMPAGSSYAEGATVSISPTAPVLSGYSFNGWLSSSGGTYSAGSTFIMGASAVTLTAQWVTLPTYYVIFNGNGNDSGSDPSPEISTGNSVTIAYNIFMRTNFTFVCWNTSADGTGTDYNPGETYTPTQTTLFYAKWKYDSSHSYTVGNTGPAGGYIIYDKTYYSDGWQYLEAAPSDASSVDFGDSDIDFSQNPLTTQNVGDGWVNTNNINAAYGAHATAVAACQNYSHANNGTTYTDWYLPSYGELELIYSLYSTISSFKSTFNQDVNDLYWSSSMDVISQYLPNVVYAYAIFMSRDTQTYGYLNFNYNIPGEGTMSVRAIRRF